MKTKPPTRVPLLWILLPLIAGIVFGRLLPFESYRALLALGALCCALAWRAKAAQPKQWSRYLAASIFILGYCYANFANTQNKPRNNLPEREAEISIEIVRLFEASETKQRGIGRIILAEDHLEDIQGAKVYFSLYTPANSPFGDSIVTGSSIRANGRLSPISREDASSNGFHSYLHNSGIAFTFDRGIILSARIQPDSWNSRFNSILKWANRSLTYGVDPNSPYTRAYNAMLLGLKSELDEDQKNLFLQSGALHVFAISGLHIGVIATCGHALFLLIRIPRPWIPIPNLILIALFVLSTGGAPSAWRALLMIACYYLCLATKRQSAALNALVLSALICLLINPIQLFLAGFQMSYATVSAILLYGVPLASRLNEYWNPFEALPRRVWSFFHRTIYTVGRFLINSFAISLSAFLASTALSIIYFNTLPLIGVLANIVLLPLASLAIISGFLSLFFATIGLAPIISLFNHAAQVVLWIMHQLLGKLGAIKGSHLEFSNPPSSILFVFLSILLIGMLYGFNRNWQFPKAWLWTIPIAYPGGCIIVTLLS